MHEIISQYRMGDMRIIYQKGKNRKGYECVGMLLVPDGMDMISEKCADIEPLIQIKLIGDDYPFNYSQGRSMRFSGTVTRMEYAGQHVEETDGEKRIITYLSDRRGIQYEHHVIFGCEDQALRVFSKIWNQSDRNISLEMFSSFTLGGITPFEKGVAADTMYLYQIRSTWANEGRVVSCPVEEYQLEPSWKPSGANGIRFGQVGSMPNREYFPFTGIEDKKNKVCWGAQLTVGSSWQMEAYRIDDALSVSGGIADREKGHWIKNLELGECFEAPEAIVSVCAGDIDELCQRITGTIQNHLSIQPEEKELPVIFNEFCTTWGNPEDKLLRKLADTAAPMGVKYFVIDAGWYKKSTEENANWSIEHGDWKYNPSLFPQGIKKLVDYIHARGMKAGIWFEPEDCGRASEMFGREDMLFSRDGYPITAGNRRFLNMLKPEVWDYLDERVLGFLKENGFDYIKIDYNDNLGIGPEGGESFGAALYESVQATQEYFRRLKNKIPGLLIENCSAGGHRLTASFLRLSDMSSFSDAHESLNIPLIAANMHRMIPVCQSQIWAVIQPEFPDALIYYKLSSAFLGRMCISGKIHELSEHQKNLVAHAIELYRDAVGIIRDGRSSIETFAGQSYKEPKGWQIVRRTWEDKELIIVHTFDDCPGEYELDVPGYDLQWSLKRDDIAVSISGGKMRLRGIKAFDGIVCCMKKSLF